MNTAVVMALTGVVFNAGYDLINRKASIINRKSGTWTFYLMASVSSCLVALLLNVLTKGMNGFSIGRQDLLYGIVIGIISSITFILYLKSFSGDNTSTSVTIFRMNMIPSIILAVFFLGETISLRRGIAIIVCIISVLMLNSWKFGKLPDMRYLLPSLGAFLFGGILNFVNKMAVTAGCNSFSLLFIRFLVVSVIAGTFILVRKSFYFDKKVVKYAVGSGMMIIGAIYFILEGLKRGDIALVLPITQLSFILVVIISWLFFKEKMNTVKIIGIFLAIGSIFLIN
jgi:uncharacterized membrane protein